MGKICKNCATVNDDKFCYCKNCGTPLDATEKVNNGAGYTKSYYNYSNPVLEEIDGISTEEIGVFVGANKQKIIDKFSKMSITSSKLSWCWPAAILSLFFGFFGAAFWLFYRKMYKYGAIALTIAVIVLGINTAVTYQPTIEFFEQAANAFYELKGTSPDFQSFSNLFGQALSHLSATRPMMLSNFLNEVATYAATTIYGLFGMYLYKKHTVKKIAEYRLVNKDSEYYSYGIKTIGGTSTGMAVLIVIITIALQNIVSSIPFLSLILF